MKRRMVLLIVLAGFFVFALVIACDPIYRLGIRLTWSSLRLSGFGWESGMTSMPLGPTSAKPEDVWRDKFPRNTDQVLETRRVLVLSMVSGFEICTGVLVEQNHERWIYLFYPRRGEWVMKMFPG
jgi:hypothetical protein